MSAKSRLIPDDRVQMVTATLLLGSALSLVLLVARAAFVGHLQLSYYVWNLALAWLPLIFAMRVYRLNSQVPRSRRRLAGWAVLWFLFFPNAAYLVTDFIHLRPRPPVPMWFDLILMMSFAWTGVLLGYLSLLLMQEVVRHRLGSRWGWKFAITMLGLGSLGIYLGRFLRWNSWDVFTRPLGLVTEVVDQFDLDQHQEPVAFFVVFFVFSILSYAPMYALTHLRPAPRILAEAEES